MAVMSVAESSQGKLDRYPPGAPRAAFGLFAGATTAFMTLAWLGSDSRYLQAESGLGYALGIAGVTMMVLLLLYPLRKRLGSMQRWGQLRGWFRLHMLLGVLGPCCIVLHSNFQLGSTNSSIALIAMLLVAGSGLIGRYLYGKFHFGLYGEQVKLQQILADLDTFYEGVNAQWMDTRDREHLQELYNGCHEIAHRQQQSVSLKLLLGQRHWLRRQTRNVRTVGKLYPELQENFRALALLLDRLAGLRLFERLFGVWHIVHIPVFLLMVITAIVHIFVVHWY